MRAKNKLTPEEDNWLTYLGLRDYYRNNIYDLVHDLLGGDKITVRENGARVKQYNKRLHGLMGEFIQQSEYANCDLQVARDHFKTTMKDGWLIQYLLRHPDRGILMLMSSEGKANDFSRKIRTQFLRNHKLRKFFPDYCPPEGINPKSWGRAGHFTLPKSEGQLLDPPLGNYLAMGIDGDYTGYHPSLIACDDVVDEDDTSEATIAAAIKQFELLGPIAGADGTILVIGTRFADYDIMGELMNGRFGENWKHMIVPATVGGAMSGKIVFPERYSREKLKEKLELMGSFQFGAQYLLDPVPAEEATLKPEWFHINPEFEVIVKEDGLYIDDKKKYLEIFMGVDPAYTQNDKSDYTAIVVGGVDENGHWWILDCRHDKIKMEDLYPKAVEIAEYWNVRRVGWENNALQGEYLRAFKKYIRENQCRFSVVGFHPNEKGFYNRNKTDRIIMTVEPPLSQGRIHLRAGIGKELENQCVRVPKGRYDDLPDALTYLLWHKRKAAPVRKLQASTTSLQRYKKEQRIRSAYARMVSTDSMWGT